MANQTISFDSLPREIIYFIVKQITDPATFRNFSLSCHICAEECKYDLSHAKKRMTKKIEDCSGGYNHVLPNGKKHGMSLVKYWGGNDLLYGNYIDNEEDGEWKQWNQHGLLIKQYNKSKGVFNVKNNTWYYNGQLQVECTYKNGLEDGVKTTWYKNGKVESECVFNCGISHGEWKNYDDNGNIYMLQTFDNGHRTGPCKIWNEYGQLIASYTF